jgi:hypothetical protein
MPTRNQPNPRARCSSSVDDFARRSTGLRGAPGGGGAPATSSVTASEADDSVRRGSLRSRGTGEVSDAATAAALGRRAKARDSLGAALGGGAAPEFDEYGLGTMIGDEGGGGGGGLEGLGLGGDGAGSEYGGEGPGGEGYTGGADGAEGEGGGGEEGGAPAAPAPSGRAAAAAAAAGAGGAGPSAVRASELRERRAAAAAKRDAAAAAAAAARGLGDVDTLLAASVIKGWLSDTRFVTGRPTHTRGTRRAPFTAPRH